jgi:hypothetical protein
LGKAYILTLPLGIVQGVGRCRIKRDRECERKGEKGRRRKRE